MHKIIYVKELSRGFAGKTFCIVFLPISIILIKEQYKEDRGLLAHEKEHAKQHNRSFTLHPVFYLLSKKYRLNSEIQAYKIQDSYNKTSKLELYARMIATKYGLKITEAEVLKQLKEKK